MNSAYYTKPRGAEDFKMTNLSGTLDRGDGELVQDTYGALIDGK